MNSHSTHIGSAGKLRIFKRYNRQELQLSLEFKPLNTCIYNVANNLLFSQQSLHALNHCRASQELGNESWSLIENF